MAWYTPTISHFTASKPDLQYPALYKNIQPPLHDSNFRSICANTSSKVLFAHIRAATATAIAPPNNHPFTFGVYTVMHNGYISTFAKIKRKMCEIMSQEAYEHIEGGTDTEHFAALLMTNLCKNSKVKGEEKRGEGEPATPNAWEQIYPIEAMREALESTISQIIKIQKETLGSTAEPNDLNIAFTNGKSLVACRFRNHATEQPPSLYYSTTAGVTLNRLYPDHPDGAKGPHGAAKGGAEKGVEGHNPQAKKGSEEHGKHVIVASEPTTYKDREWELIEKNRVVMVENGEGIRVEELRV